MVVVFHVVHDPYATFGGLAFGRQHRGDVIRSRDVILPRQAGRPGDRATE